MHLPPLATYKVDHRGKSVGSNQMFPPPSANKYTYIYILNESRTFPQKIPALSRAHTCLVRAILHGKKIQLTNLALFWYRPYYQLICGVQRAAVHQFRSALYTHQPSLRMRRSRHCQHQQRTAPRIGALLPYPWQTANR